MSYHVRFTSGGALQRAPVFIVSCALLLLGLLLPLHAGTTLASIDFEGGNDFPSAFFFSDSNLVPITVNQNSPNGNGGTEGAEVTVAATTGDASFTGGGWGSFDLANDPQFVAGSITVAQLIQLNVSFDMEVVGTGISNLRCEANLPSGDFANRVELPTPSGPFASYSVDFSTLHPTQLANMAASLNANNVTDLTFAFNFDADSTGNYVAGNAVRLDNFVASIGPPGPLPSDFGDLPLPYPHAREGDPAPSTGSDFKTLSGLVCNNVGGVAWLGFTPQAAAGTASKNNIGIWVDRGSQDDTAELIVRRGDTFQFNPLPAPMSTVAGVDLQNVSHPSGGTGGFGKSLNDAGEILLKLVLGQNPSGIFLLGNPPSPNIESLDSRPSPTAEDAKVPVRNRHEKRKASRTPAPR